MTTADRTAINNALDRIDRADSLLADARHALTNYCYCAPELVKHLGAIDSLRLEMRLQHRELLGRLESALFAQR